MELDHEEPIILVRVLRLNDVVLLDLLPVFDLLEFIIGLHRGIILLPLLPRVDHFDLVLVKRRDDDVEAFDLVREGAETDRVEVKCLLPHVFEHSVEREMIVLTKTKFKEGLLSSLLLAEFGLELFEEADEELDVALLTVDGEGLSILGALAVVVLDGILVVLKHAKEDKKCTDHHSCATFASLAVDDYYWLALFFVGTVHSFPCHLMILLHSRQEQARVKAELEDLL